MENIVDRHCSDCSRSGAWSNFGIFAGFVDATIAVHKLKIRPEKKHRLPCQRI